MHIGDGRVSKSCTGPMRVAVQGQSKRGEGLPIMVWRCRNMCCGCVLYILFLLLMLLVAFVLFDF